MQALGIEDLNNEQLNEVFFFSHWFLTSETKAAVLHFLVSPCHDDASFFAGHEFGRTIPHALTTRRRVRLSRVRPAQTRPSLDVSRVAPRGGSVRLSGVES